MAALRDKLGTARHLHRLVILLHAALAGMAGGLAGYIVLASGWLPDLALNPILLVLALSLFCFAIALALQRRHLPSVNRLAVMADDLTGSHEQIRTALEWPSPDRDASPFADGLVRRALGVLDNLGAFALAPRVSWPLIAIALGLAVFAAVIVPEPVQDRGGVPTPPPAAMSSGEREVVVEALETIAVELADAAREVQSQYLAAIAREVTTLGGTVADGSTADRAALAQDVTRLQGHAARALAGARSAEGEATLQRMGDLSQSIAEGASLRAPAGPERQAATDPQTASPATDAAAEPPAEQAPQQDQGPREIAGSPSSSRDRSAGAERPEGPVLGPCQIDGEESCMAPRDTNYSADRSMGPGEQAQALGSLSSAEAPPDAQEGMLIGPASQSGTGESAEAGQGSQELLGADANEILFELEDLLELSAERMAEAQAGTRQTAAPDAAAQAFAAAGALNPNAGWVQHPELPTERERLSPDMSSVLARYFERDSVDEGNAGP